MLYHHHKYLLPPLLELILQQKTNQRHKLKVLDLGCGNGSLSQKIAQQGYEVVGVEDSTSGILFHVKILPNVTLFKQVSTTCPMPS